MMLIMTLFSFYHPKHPGARTGVGIYIISNDSVRGREKSGEVRHSRIMTGGNCGAYKLPFVDQTPLTRGSAWVAWSRALAKALKAHSQMWWSFSPRIIWKCRFMPAAEERA